MNPFSKTVIKNPFSKTVIMTIIDKLTYNNYTMENIQPVSDAIELLQRLDVDEDGVLYFRRDE